MKNYKVIYKSVRGEESLNIFESKEFDTRPPEKFEYFGEYTIIIRFAIQALTLSHAWDEAKTALSIHWKVKL